MAVASYEVKYTKIILWQYFENSFIVSAKDCDTSTKLLLWGQIRPLLKWATFLVRLVHMKYWLEPKNQHRLSRKNVHNHWNTRLWNKTIPSLLRVKEERWLFLGHFWPLTFEVSCSFWGSFWNKTNIRLSLSKSLIQAVKSMGLHFVVFVGFNSSGHQYWNEAWREKASEKIGSWKSQRTGDGRDEETNANKNRRKRMLKMDLKYLL